MNDFVLKEKKELWGTQITLEEYIENTKRCGYIDCNEGWNYEFTYIINNLEKVNNLQSKIDKANEILDKWGEEPDADMYMQIKEYKEWKELKDIIKEDK